MKASFPLLLLVALLSVIVFISAPVSSSTPSEPPFQQQLKGCFENNKDTTIMASESRWNSARPSIFPSYADAGYFARDCRRRVCGLGNTLCCNTYCSMYGYVSQTSSYNDCQGQCISSSFVTSPRIGNGNGNGDSYSGDGEIISTSTYSSCEIPCNTVFKFYSFTTNGPTKKVLDPSRSTPSKSGPNSKPKLPIQPMPTNRFVKLIRPSSHSSRTSRRGASTLGTLEHVVTIPRVLKKSLSEVVRAEHTGENVPINAICTKDTTGKASILFNPSASGLTCAHILSWSGVKEVSPTVIDYVLVMMYDLYGQCMDMNPKAQCSTPRVDSIHHNSKIV